MYRTPSTLIGFAVLVVLGAVACDDHEPELERQGPPLPDSGTPSTACPSDGAGGEGGVPSAPIRFCQAEIVLRTVCQRCHQEPPLNGAPFPLVTYEDTQELFAEGVLRWERMKEVVEIDFMPLRGGGLDPPVERLTCDEKSTLMGWLEQCAKPLGGTDCSGTNESLALCDERWRPDAD
jgi:hypothetical protein